jgi:hypothetical protein
MQPVECGYSNLSAASDADLQAIVESGRSDVPLGVSGRPTTASAVMIRP